MRVGLGYDVHRLVSGRPLIIGGEKIAFPKGLLGHSDGDVLIHAIMDALLGAAGLKDIGFHFPDTDQQYKDISSLILLERVKELLKEEGYNIFNIDATILAQAPKLSPFIESMKNKIANTLGLHTERIGIKATTGEGLGFIGRQEGIAAIAVALVTKDEAI